MTDAREGCGTLERKAGGELNSLISREEAEGCTKREKNGKQ